MTKNSQVVDLIIEGSPYKWHEQHITGEQVKKLAHLDKNANLYLSIPEPWDDEAIGDQDIVDLARPEIELFYVKRPLPYTINGTYYESDRQFIRGHQIRKQANIPKNQQIYLVHKGPWEDELVLDNDLIDLARPGTEHFVSRPEHVKVIIIVNGREKEWEARDISFENLVMIAYPDYNPTAGKVYTVVFKKGPVQNPDGSMVSGQTVRVKNKMVFNVTETTRS